MFIDLFVGEIDFGAVRNDQRELHSFRARPPRLQQDALHAGENQFAHRSSVRGCLRFEPAIERRGNIDRGANAILLHKGYYPMCAINMELHEASIRPTVLQLKVRLSGEPTRDIVAV